ncbi:hypothetical protein AB0H71_33650 [Nocardia sp. NPDC050697]|uniref:hypothetical protein n=1 Tax=Nocardia sp. NPDC050697 TaxID=3155158 RepID=UPI0033F8D5AB
MSGGGKLTGGSGASGVGGGQAISDRLSELAEGVKSPVTTDRGLSARLRYLTKSSAGYEAMESAGLDVTARTFTAWLAEERTPNAANLAKIEAAYTDLHHQNMAGSLKRRLSGDGTGTRIEVHPVDQSAVPPEQQRDLRIRRVTVRPDEWTRLVDQWAAGDIGAMNATWAQVAADTLGTDWHAYEAVDHIGFGA